MPPRPWRVFRITLSILLAIVGTEGVYFVVNSLLTFCFALVIGNPALARWAALHLMVGGFLGVIPLLASMKLWEGWRTGVGGAALFFGYGGASEGTKVLAGTEGAQSLFPADIQIVGSVFLIVTGITLLVKARRYRRTRDGLHQGAIQN